MIEEDKDLGDTDKQLDGHGKAGEKTLLYVASL